VFLRESIPSDDNWLEHLKVAIEPDAVRILEYRQLDELRLQFLISSQPDVPPSQIVRSIKGRLQHLVRKSVPKAFQRNYGIYSVGEANNACLDAYVGNQPSRHPMADSRIHERIKSLQYIDENVNLEEPRLSSHGQFLQNLHIVLENREHRHDSREATLLAIRSMIIRCCLKKQHLLARIGLLSNHVHVLLGCGVDESPQTVVLALMNNLAYALGMESTLEFSFYIGTFGPYDRGAIRRQFM
jgi:REP element-mobilizing transposase RayT